MKTSKSVKLYFILVSVIVFVMLNVFIFALNRNYDGNFWSGYIFTVIAYLIANALCILPMCIGKEKEIFHAVPVMMVSIIYIVLQVLAGMCIIFVPRFNVLASVVLQLFLLSVYLIISLALLFYKGSMESNRYKTKSERQFRNDLEFQLIGMMSYSENASRTDRIRDLLEQVRYECANNSIKETEDLENEIVEMLGRVRFLLHNGESKEYEQACDMLSAMLKQRDAMCKTRG